MVGLKSRTQPPYTPATAPKSLGPAGPRGNGHVVGAPDARGDGAAGKGHGLGAEPVDVVLALDADAGVLLDAGDELDELVVAPISMAKIRCV